MPRKKKLTDDELRTYVEHAIANSGTFQSSDVKANFTRALDAYYGRDKPVATEGGLSQAISQDTADMVEAVTSQMVPAFNYDELGSFKARGHQDVAQARVESRIVCSFLRDKNNGNTLLQAASRNAGLLRNAIINVETTRRYAVDERRYKNLSELELYDVLQPSGPDELVERFNPEQNPDGGIDITIRRTTEFKRLDVRVVDNTRFLVWEEWDEETLAHVPVCGEQRWFTRSDLVEFGFPKKLVYELPRGNAHGETNTAALARNRNKTSPVRETGDPAMQQIECYQLYMLVDYDGDGIAELRKILYAGGTTGGQVLENLLAARVPYASGTCILQPNRWMGMSIYDKLCELEVQKTEVIRQWQDNIAYANNSELLVDENYMDVDDGKRRRPGGMIRTENVDLAAKELQMNDNGQSALAHLNYLDGVRTERAGASLELNTGAAQLADSPTGNVGDRGDRENLVQLFCTTFADTVIRQTLLLIHETLRSDFRGPLTVDMGRDYVTSDPSQWPYREELTVSAGMTSQARAALIAALEKAMFQTEKLIQAGAGAGIMTNFQTYYDLLIDWLQANGVPNPRKYFIDPRSPASLRAQMTQQQQQQLAQAMEQQKANDLYATQVGIENRKDATRLIDGERERAYKRWSDILDSTVEELKVENNQANQAELDRVQAAGAANG